MKDIRHKGLNESEIKRLTEYHKHRKVNIENDDLNFMVCEPGFLKNIERQGISRGVLSDLGFDMDPGHDKIEEDTIHLGAGYQKFDREKNDFVTVRGEGAGKILLQGVRK